MGSFSADIPILPLEERRNYERSTSPRVATIPDSHPDVQVLVQIFMYKKKELYV
jgi:hypothetical protein